MLWTPYKKTDFSLRHIPSLIVLMVSVDVKQRWTAELGSCVKVKVAVLGFHSLTVLMVSMDVNQHWRAELGSCVNVKVAVLGFHSLIVLMVLVDVKQHLKKKNCVIRAITSRMVLYFRLSFFRPTSDRVIVIYTNAVAFLCWCVWASFRDELSPRNNDNAMHWQHSQPTPVSLR